MNLLGYSKQISVFPGEKVDFLVSSKFPEYEADIVQLIHGDTHPDGPGEKIKEIETHVTGQYSGREQKIYDGSCLIAQTHPRLNLRDSWTLQCVICPTTPEKGLQGIMTKWDNSTESGYGLFIGENGDIEVRVGNGKGAVEKLSTGKQLISGLWYLVSGSLDEGGTLTVRQTPILTPTNSRFAFLSSKESTEGEESKKINISAAETAAPFVVAASYLDTLPSGRVVTHWHYNGKIDRPRVHNAALTNAELESQLENPRGIQLICAWNFQNEITKKGIKEPDKITDVSFNKIDAEAINCPTRAVTGYNWMAQEQNFIHAPEQYGAIHFHDDDLADAQWDVDFTLNVPEDMPSGLYAARLRAEGETEYIPFYVRAKRGEEKKICFLAPTASYMAYANDHVSTTVPFAQLMIARVPVMDKGNIVLSEHSELGLSTYDHHSDGSGVAYSSRLRPILNMRPGFRHWLSPSLWQFNADLHLIDWLIEKGYEFDVLTDEDLHLEGVDALSPYKVVLTGSHPEYYTEQMLNATHQFVEEGGRLMYFGGNGYYWVTAYHPENPAIIEVRKGHGSNAWKSKPGEYHLSFTGEYGSLWRHRGRAPQRLVGVGFGSEGFDVSSYFVRTADGLDNGAASWMFEGIAEDEKIGDFGLVGGGAAGLELDIYDASLGTPPETVIGAVSVGHTDVYVEVVEELYFNVPGTGGTQNARVRGDITYFPTQGGGGVWSCSSISYCGSLSYNNYNNNVSRLTSNVLNRFLEDGAAPKGAFSEE